MNITAMKTVGQILQTARLSKKLDLDHISRITRIREQFLTAIETDNYGQLPSGAVARGFIKNYAEFLHLNLVQILAVFRRDFVENELGQIVPRGMVQPVSEVSLWTPRTTLIAIITLVFTLFAAYLIFQYRLLTGPPPLEITQPLTDQIVSENTIEVAGVTDPQAVISVNGELVALEKGGKFFFRLPISRGENKITVTATSKFGKTRSLTRTINKP